MIEGILFMSGVNIVLTKEIILTAGVICVFLEGEQMNCQLVNLTTIMCEILDFSVGVIKCEF
jgi:hypothetical protein